MLDVVAQIFLVASTAILFLYYVGNSTVQNHDSGGVLVGQGDPTIIMVLNGKISYIVKEQIWLYGSYN
jgi:hypothetical protein